MTLLSETDGYGWWHLGDAEWRDVPGFEGLYAVSSEGQFRSLYFDPPRPLSHGRDSNGYPTIMLSKDGKRSPFTVHRLVCRAFHGEPYLIWNEAAHIDGDRTNPRADNLKWVSKVENHFHQRAHGTHMAGEKHPRATLTDDRVTELLALSADGMSSTALGMRFGITTKYARAIQTGARWGHLSLPSLSQGELA